MRLLNFICNQKQTKSTDFAVLYLKLKKTVLRNQERWSANRAFVRLKKPY